MTEKNEELPKGAEKNLAGEDWLAYAVSGWRYMLSKGYRKRLSRKWETQQPMLVVRDMIGGGIAVAATIIGVVVLAVGLFDNWQSLGTSCCKMIIYGDVSEVEPIVSMRLQFCQKQRSFDKMAEPVILDSVIDINRYNDEIVNSSHLSWETEIGWEPTSEPCAFVVQATHSPNTGTHVYHFPGAVSLASLVQNGNSFGMKLHPDGSLSLYTWP